LASPEAGLLRWRLRVEGQRGTCQSAGVEDIAFHRKAGITISEMVRSAWVFRRLRDFRSGIEGVISTLKRAFQMDRCT
jgi:IS5 family transposase